MTDNNTELLRMLKELKELGYEYEQLPDYGRKHEHGYIQIDDKSHFGLAGEANRYNLPTIHEVEERIVEMTPIVRCQYIQIEKKMHIGDCIYGDKDVAKWWYTIWYQGSSKYGVFYNKNRLLAALGMLIKLYGIKG